MRTVHISPNPVFSLGATTEKDFSVSNWGHRITASVGFDSASFDLTGPKSELEDMFMEGCGRRVTRYTPDGHGIVWDGYIAEMILSEPGLQKRISLREMANGIIVRYTPIDTSTNPPTYGVESWTPPVDDAGYSSMDLTSLISHWKLNEASGNAIDAHGTNTLTDVNTVTSAAGKLAGARQFTAASSEYFWIADNASLSTGDIDFSVCAWVYLDSKGAIRIFAGKQESAAVREWQVRYDSAVDRFNFLVFNSAGAAIGTVNADILGSPSTATWYFVVAWHNSVANTVNIQINNGTVNSAATTGVPSDTTARFLIGAVNAVAANFMNGRIDSVSFWKRVLTTTERTLLYNSGNGLDYNFITGSSSNSQARYGVKQKVFVPPSNKLIDAAAIQFGNVLLAHYRMPIRSEIKSDSDELNLRVVCDGYMRTLDWHTYIQTALSGADNANTIMSTIVSVTGQGFISGTDFDANTTQVQKYFLNFDTGFDLVQLIANLGDASNNRWLAYVLEDRILHYKPASTTVDYFRRISDNRQEIYDLFGRVVPQWEVRPNHWMRTSDIVSSSLPNPSLQDDFQLMFIESVDWTEPDGLTLAGAPGDNLRVSLARMAARGDQML